MRHSLHGLWIVFFLAVTAISPHEVNIQTGSLKGDIGPAVDFGIATYKHGAYRIGAFTSPEVRGVVASYSSTASPFILELGQRERSLDQGFVIGNGAYLPWTKNFAFSEPMGVRAGYQTRYLGLSSGYYQRDAQNAAAANLQFTPVSWFRVSAGAAATNVELAEKVIPLAAIQFGNAEERTGFTGGLEYAGAGNYLAHGRYSGDFTLRGFVFLQADARPLASGIYAEKNGVVLQLMSDAWFAQFFQTDSRFGMLRYAGEYLTAVAVYEEKVQLAGVSLRNSATGFHLRSGATLAGDGSLQTLAGLGYGDYVFLGGGHYALTTDQPLEPILFPSEWYSSVLLQSTSMRVKDQGYKMLTLVKTEVIQGFLAITYAEDARGRERFGFFMRVSGGMTF